VEWEKQQEGGGEISPHRGAGSKGKTERAPRRGCAGEEIVAPDPLGVLRTILSIDTSIIMVGRCSLRGSPLTPGPRVRIRFPPAASLVRNLHFSIRRRKFAKRDGEARRASQTLDRAERRAEVVAKRSQTSRTPPGSVDRPGEAVGGSP
jgi:hypothetical protein